MLVGYDIMRGPTNLTKQLRPDFAHLIVACLFHADWLRPPGNLMRDSADGYIVDAKGNKAKLPARPPPDAALLPYHVDRSKLFAIDRLSKAKSLDATRVANAIEFTRLSAISVAPTMATAKKASWSALPISSASSAIRIICARPMRFITNSKKSG